MFNRPPYAQLFHAILLILVGTVGRAQSPGDSEVIVQPTDSVIAAGTSPDSKASPLETDVSYGAEDSMRYDLEAQKVYLYGNAHVEYGSVNLRADYIEIDLKNKRLEATGSVDSTGQRIGDPIFVDKEQEFTSKRMAYNFVSKKGKISEVITQEGDGYLHGEQVKKEGDKVIYVKNGKYTTCNLPDPHFHIAARKLKVIKDDKIVTGPAHLRIADVPTPLAVPFGFFPNQRKRSSGIIIPTYGRSFEQGFFLSGGGYYFGLSDYFDLAVRSDVYTRGSWAVNVKSNYKKRYKYNGNLNLDYASFKLGSCRDCPDDTLVSRTFFVRWNYSQDPKARPYGRFSADVNAGSTNNFRNNINSSSLNYLTNTFTSNISYSLQIPRSPFRASFNARHSQNSADSSITLSIPEVTLTMQRVFPLARKYRSGPQRWYEKIGMSYTSNLRNRFTTHQDSLFHESTLDKMQNGMRHNVPIGTNIKLLKYLTLSPTANYTEVWYQEENRMLWDAANDTLLSFTDARFSRFSSLRMSAAMNTRLYGMFTFKGEGIEAIRHVMTPSVNISYLPNLSRAFGYYETVQSDTAGNTLSYSRFSGLFGSPSNREAANIGFGLNNNLEMKVKTKKDTANTTKKITLIESLNLTGNYNLLADSLHWSTINMLARTHIFQKLGLQLSAILDPYAINEGGTRIQQFVWDNNKKLGRLTRATAAVNMSFTGSGIRSQPPPPPPTASEAELDMIYNHPNHYVDFNIPWSLNLYYNMTYSKAANTSSVSNALNFNGDFRLTPKWKIGFRSGYDFEDRDFTYTTIDIHRDLHCWDMAFNLVPFGAQRSYRFDIKVKASVLQDLKLSRRRNWFDLD